MEMVVGLDSLDVPRRMAEARHRIILHAAVYGAFAGSPDHCRALKAAIGKPDFKGLDCIVLAPGNGNGWTDAFCRAMRFDISPQGINEEVRASYDFVRGLASEHPGAVRLHHANRLPCLPVLIIDDTIIFGHYAHAEHHAPSGFWSAIEAPVENLLEWARRGSVPPWASERDIAAFRLVSECVRAMNSTHTGELHDA